MKKVLCLAIVAFLNSLLCLGQVKIDRINYEIYILYKTDNYNRKILDRRGNPIIEREQAILTSAPTTLSGKITVPSSITHKGKTYEVTVIERFAFSGCSHLTSIVLPSSIYRIGDHAFQNCTELNSISFSGSLTELGAGAFLNCLSLTSVELPIIHNTYGGLESLSSDLFNGCISLVYVTIPSSIDRIGANVFKDCKNLSDIFCYPTKVPSIPSLAYGSTFSGTKREEIRIHVPKESLDKYKNSNWNVFKTIDTNMTRPQVKTRVKNQGLDLNTNEIKAIDMGGSVEWANMNLESTTPEDPGGIFAWGEISSRTGNFTRSNYTAPTLKSLGRSVYDGVTWSKYDAAISQWGHGWRMPTEDEFKELYTTCRKIKHKEYIELIAPNGNRLFFPILLSADISRNGIGNLYWTSNESFSGPICCEINDWFSGYFSMSTKERYNGGFIRPVRDK